MRAALFLTSLLLVTTPAFAQVLVHFPVIDDSEPQRFFQVELDARYVLLSRSLQHQEPHRFRAMTHDYSSTTFLAAREIYFGRYSLHTAGLGLSSLREVGELAYEVEGLVLGSGLVLYGVAWQESEWRSVLVEIDRTTAATTVLASLPLGVRLRGLTNFDYGGDFYAVSRDPVTDASAIYRIDATTFAIEHLVDLPAPCEAIGAHDSGGLVAAGARWFRVQGVAVEEIELTPPENEAPLVEIVAMARVSGFSAVEPVTWGRIKSHFTDR